MCADYPNRVLCVRFFASTRQSMYASTEGSHIENLVYLLFRRQGSGQVCELRDIHNN